MFTAKRNSWDDVELPWKRRTPLFDREERPEAPRPFRPSVPKPTTPIVAPMSEPTPKPAIGQGSAASVSAGQHIVHNRFGRGEVLRVEGTGDSMKATVQFENVGTKQLLLKFAKFVVID